MKNTMTMKANALVKTINKIAEKSVGISKKSQSDMIYQAEQVTNIHRLLKIFNQYNELVADDYDYFQLGSDPAVIGTARADVKRTVVERNKFAYYAKESIFALNRTCKEVAGIPFLEFHQIHEIKISQINIDDYVELFDDYENVLEAAIASQDDRI